MPSRYFALIPAAGHSARMGQPKLLLPLGGKPLIAHALEAWRTSAVDRMVVVVRPDDDDLAAAVRDEPRVEVVVPGSPPPDMKASIQAALAHLQKTVEPSADDAFLVAPADMPGLSPAIISRLIECHQRGDQRAILAPVIKNERGHPVLFPWSLAPQVFQLRPHEGLNAIAERAPVELIPCDDLLATGDAPFADIDTREQYDQIIQQRLPNNFN